MTDSARFYAHTSESDSRDTWHGLAEHLIATGSRARAMLGATGCEELAEVAGLLHDLGKYTSAFQRRLSGDGSRVNHSTAGAKVAVERYGPLIGKVLAYAIAGHHAGLANGVAGGRISSLKDRLDDKTIPAVDSAWMQEIELPDSINPPEKLPRTRETIGFSASFLIRMVFSALVDADFLDTLSAIINETSAPLGSNVGP